jgi:molecular chaperone GrpE
MTDEPQIQQEQEQVEEDGEDKLAVLEDRLLRVAADFDNYKKRAAREREQYVMLANERFVKELLPVLDDLERALEAGEEHAIEEGVRLVHRSLASLLERHGVKEIDTAGAFDPHVHEALLSQPSEAEEGSVIDVVQKGYTLGDRVMRPARVVVAAPMSGSDA